MIEIISILTIIIILCIFIIFNLVRKIEKIDDELVDVSLNMEEFIVSVKTIKEKMHQIDSKGLFESDDEVGTVFTGINNLITQIDIKYDNNENKNEK